jgi:hypothetical protein
MGLTTLGLSGKPSGHIRLCLRLLGHRRHTLG